MQVVVFQALGDPFAVPVSAVREVVRDAVRRAVPGGVAWVAGVADVRGTLLPVVDLGLRLGRRSTGLAGDLLVVEAGGSTAAVPVERVLGLETLGEVAPPPGGATEVASGVAFARGELVLVLEPAALVPGAVEAVLEDRAREGAPVDLRAHAGVQRAALRWRPGTVLSSGSLRSLELTHYTGKDLRGLAGLPGLRSLTLEFGPLERLDGLAALGSLEELRLRRLRRLVSVEGAERLRVLEVRGCPKVSDR